MNRFIRWLAAGIIANERQKAYLQGLKTGREERPMTCGVAQKDHCIHDYLYDPGC